MTNVHASAALLARLPRDDQERLHAVARDARNLLGGQRDFQSLFDGHLATFQHLRRGGLTHTDIGLLLAAVGIRRADGGPLTRGTISSGLSRARERADARAAHASSAPLPRAADRCSAVQLAAPGSAEMLQPAAAGGTKLQRSRRRPAEAKAAPPPAARPPLPASAAGPPLATFPPAEGDPPGTETAASNMRAAKLLNHIRRTR